MFAPLDDGERAPGLQVAGLGAGLDHLARDPDASLIDVVAGAFDYELRP